MKRGKAHGVANEFYEEDIPTLFTDLIEDDFAAESERPSTGFMDAQPSANFGNNNAQSPGRPPTGVSLRPLTTQREPLGRSQSINAIANDRPPTQSSGKRPGTSQSVALPQHSLMSPSRPPTSSGTLAVDTTSTIGLQRVGTSSSSAASSASMSINLPAITSPGTSRLLAMGSPVRATSSHSGPSMLSTSTEARFEQARTTTPALSRLSLTPGILYIDHTRVCFQCKCRVILFVYVCVLCVSAVGSYPQQSKDSRKESIARSSEVCYGVVNNTIS